MTSFKRAPTLSTVPRFRIEARWRQPVPILGLVASVALFVVGTVGSAAQAEPDQAFFHERVVATYSFHPHELDDQALKAKSAELDTFWTFVKGQGPLGLQLLRSELSRADKPIFFNYDGAKLLLSLSHTPADRSLALAAIARADLRDIQPTDYFLTVHEFAVEGFDTTDAAFKILSDAKFQAFIPVHALTLDQDMCLAYMLLPTNEDFYLSRAAERLQVETDVTAQKSLICVLADTVTEAGDTAVQRFAGDQTKPEESRQYAETVFKATGSMGSVPVLSSSVPDGMSRSVSRFAA